LTVVREQPVPLDLPPLDRLPEGPKRALVERLRLLYARAGYPGVKKIANAIRQRDDLPDVVSHETVSTFLQGEGSPRWSKLEVVVRQLVAWSIDRPDADVEVMRFYELWAAATGRPSAEPVHPDTAHARAPVEFADQSPHPVGLVIEREAASLSYVDGRYQCTVRRALFNHGTEPLTRFPVTIVVNRFPDEPQRSTRYHHDHPLTFDELALVASCNGEPMNWRVSTDQDAQKMVWLLLENAAGRFPCYPGQRATIVYSFHVDADKWGNWFMRTVRLPTRSLAIEVEFPADLRPMVWGVRSSLWGEDAPFPTPIAQELTADGRALLSWETTSATLHDSYRFEWRFRHEPDR
jgi:hypothetical protein